MAKRKIDYAKSEYPNSFKRQGAFPLDETSVKYSKYDLDTYAKSHDDGAYVGQIVTVVPPDANSKTEAETYVIYSEDGSVNRLVKESELLALDSASTLNTTRDNLRYISNLSQTNGMITASHKFLQGTASNISVTATADGNTTIKDIAKYEHSSTNLDTTADNLEYLVEVTQTDGTIAAKKKTLQGTKDNISITVGTDGKTVIKDVAKVEDTAYQDTDSKYVAKVTQTNGEIAYIKHTIVQGDSISVSTSGGKTTIGNTAAYADTAEDNKYVSEVDQNKGEISVSRRTILENTEEDTANSASTTTSNGNVDVITSFVEPTGDKGIIPKKRTIKGAKGVEVIVGNSTSDITVQHTHEDITAKTETSQTEDSTAITNGGTFTISDVNYDAQGHVTGENTATLTVPKYSGGTGISITLDTGTTNEYTITNDASVNSPTNNTTDSKDYIVSVSGSNGSVTPTKKVLTAGTGITITTGTGSTDAEKTKLTIGHSNSVTAKTSYSDISTDANAQVNIITPKYNAQGHVIGTADQTLTVSTATGSTRGTVRAGYSSTGANIKLNVEDDGDAYVTLTDSAIRSAITAFDWYTYDTNKTCISVPATLIIQANSSNMLGVTSTGVGVYGTLYTQYDINTDGNITVAGTDSMVTAGSFYATSDARLKENFEPLQTGSILELPTYKFDFINGAKNQIGCKAQDLQEICPEIVHEGSDGHLSIQESKIVYLLLEEVKKLRKELDELKK